MTASESLFDSKFTQEPMLLFSSDGMTNDVDLGKSLITYRMLVSKREAGAIIGKNGDNITRIREQTNVKAGVSKVIEGCIDRILTVTGIVDNVPKALVQFAKAVTDSNVQTVASASANGTDPTSLITYNFFPLKPLCPSPAASDPFYAETLSLRLLIPHSQMGTLIGKGGSRIKSIQETYNIKMVASKDYLRNSTERIVEVQGAKANLVEALNTISRCLLSNYHGVVATIYYTPSPRQPPYKDGYKLDPLQGTGSDKEISEKTSFPGEFVGALIGKKGSRIQEIRRTSGCTINIEAEDNEQGQREFTLTGTTLSVDRALSSLYSCFEKEKQRRDEQMHQG
ncbi:hypothetical protein KL930_001262 [Ogataea haglerorum]|uniref:K Homology domain-containing protein n=1 Tax=Ogataea haglerorum TaxID=1937702 RepID=A0AAN6D490_9ASCO|nr:uncharacterized protein KL911_003663 [Ogataea haglerorum]KAG7694939.1 hypothetical protein KL915_003172 [Ogataea haglerorum]KAG7698484.1 hypothetical protein KL951_001748 [Ogataea haglerorum]KAG7706264.1 hypothetical protein KL914_003159 [Ogataea haglerorum]KAG7708023.1 hypothetical protein KL950_002649 [Ogataea haglerorum]KAG7717179.1 hypothetical protein KL913_002930 [Ogataea haglerorum]